MSGWASEAPQSNLIVYFDVVEAQKGLKLGLFPLSSSCLMDEEFQQSLGRLSLATRARIAWREYAAPLVVVFSAGNTTGQAGLRKANDVPILELEITLREARHMQLNRAPAAFVGVLVYRCLTSG